MKRVLIVLSILFLSVIVFANIIPARFEVKKRLQDQAIYYNQFQPYKNIGQVLASLAESIDDSIFVVSQQVDSVYFIVRNPKLCPVCKSAATAWSRCFPQENLDGKHSWWIISKHLVSIAKPVGCD